MINVAANNFCKVGRLKSGIDIGGIAPGILLTRLNRLISGKASSISIAAIAPIMTAMSMAGTYLFKGLHRRMMPSVINTKAMDCHCISPLSANVLSAFRVSMTSVPRGIFIPRSVPTWLLIISTAAPAVNPTITECGTFSTHLPIPLKPNVS